MLNHNINYTEYKCCLFHNVYFTLSWICFDLNIYFFMFLGYKFLHITQFLYVNIFICRPMLVMIFQMELVLLRSAVPFLQEQVFCIFLLYLYHIDKYPIYQHWVLLLTLGITLYTDVCHVVIKFLAVLECLFSDGVTSLLIHAIPCLLHFWSVLASYNFFVKCHVHPTWG